MSKMILEKLCNRRDELINKYPFVEIPFTKNVREEMHELYKIQLQIYVHTCKSGGHITGVFCPYSPIYVIKTHE